jgi:hypothetical protein
MYYIGRQVTISYIGTYMLSDVMRRCPCIMMTQTQNDWMESVNFHSSLLKFWPALHFRSKQICVLEVRNWHVVYITDLIKIYNFYSTHFNQELCTINEVSNTATIWQEGSTPLIAKSVVGYESKLRIISFSCIQQMIYNYVILWCM